MFYVYVLVNRQKDKHYVGYTNDLRRRLSEHKQGKTYWSRRLEDPELFYYEAYTSELEAKDRERKLKQHGAAKQGLFKRIGLK